MSKPPQKAGSSAAASKAKALKFIPKTVDLLRGNDAAKRKGKGKEKSVLRGLADLVKSELAAYGKHQGPADLPKPQRVSREQSTLNALPR